MPTAFAPATGTSRSSPRGCTWDSTSARSRRSGMWARRGCPPDRTCITSFWSMAGPRIRSVRTPAPASPCRRSSSRSSTTCVCSSWRSSSRPVFRPRPRRSVTRPLRRATTSSQPPPSSPTHRVELYPAVDIEGGRVARAHGELAHPLAALDAFIRAGTRWIHLVDMDRAFGRKNNHEIIGAVLSAAATRVQVQVGGGLFLEPDIDQMFNLGATRVVIGPRGAVDSGLVERLVQRHGAHRLAAGIDARDGRVAPRGTADTLDLTAEELATRVASLGIRTIIYNEVTRDGKLTGPDTEGARKLAALGGDRKSVV